MSARTAEDLLRAEYSSLLPSIRRTAEELETEVRYLLLPVLRRLQPHERIVVKSRVKDCESAIASLRRREEYWKLKASGGTFVSLTSLNDLAGVRVLAFPKRRVLEIDDLLRERFLDWTQDPVPPISSTTNSLALKYHGYCSPRCCVRSEVQLMSMLVGMFWEVEHATLYKPGEHLRGIELALKMRNTYADVIRALNAFEAEFEALTDGLPEETSANSG